MDDRAFSMDGALSGEDLAQAVGKTEVLACHDPATGVFLGTVPIMGPAQVHQAIARARLAAVEWKSTSFAERKRVLKRLQQTLLARADELVELICKDAGKTREHALLGELWPLCEKLRWTIANGEACLKPETRSAGVLAHKKAHVAFEPLGVIANICPWNFPLQNILGPAIAALMAGNACLVKVSEWTSWSAGPFGELIAGVLRDTGHNPDLLQILTGDGRTGAALVSGGVDKVIFTGSLHNGKRVIEESAKTCTPVVLELGGKDPMIVCDDANLDLAVHTALAGCFLTSGQMCLATERLYVFDAVHDAFVQRVVAIAKELRQGPPLAGPLVDVGAMTMPGQLDIVERLVNDAIQKGATLHCGGKRLPGAGQFFAPTVLTNVTHDMDIMQHETFGPVMAIMRVAGEEEALACAGESHYGLSSSVFTKSPARARRMAQALRAGSTVINDFGLHYMAQALPFGGVGDSGFGRLNGREGLRACTNEKAVIEDRLPWRKPVVLFPVRTGDYAMTKHLIEAVYGQGVARLQGVQGLARTLWQRLRD